MSSSDLSFAAIRLPNGYRHERLGDIDSTNSEAFRRADAGDDGPLWLTAKRQIAGRGRGGRSWGSEPGNLYASLLLHIDCDVTTGQQLPFVAAVSLHDAVRSSSTERLADRLTLKWPNDLLLDGFKIAGILSESRRARSSSLLCVAIGIGVNLVHHPAETHHPASDLNALGIEVAPEVLFQALASATARWLGQWRLGAGFGAVRKAWMAASVPLGTDISVRQGSGQINGQFNGLDGDGALLIEIEDGERRVTFGEVLEPR